MKERPYHCHGIIFCFNLAFTTTAERYPRFQVCRIDVLRIACELIGFPNGRAFAVLFRCFVGQDDTALEILDATLGFFILNGFNCGAQGVFNIAANVVDIDCIADVVTVNAEVGPRFIFRECARAVPLFALPFILATERNDDTGNVKERAELCFK